MKTIYLLTACCAFVCYTLHGAIKNGYRPQLLKSQDLLREFMTLMEHQEKPYPLKQKLREKVDSLKNYISHCFLTDEILDQFRSISPGIYRDLDNITDKQGRSTDVFVKLIPRRTATVPLVAYTYFYHAPDDEDASFSEYGMFTVSVNVEISETALFLLSHELGHVKYVVPNLSEYASFYFKHYCIPGVSVPYVGHHRNDLSGKSASAFGKRFREDWKVYIKKGNRKPKSSAALLAQIRKNDRLLQVPYRLPDPLVTFISY